MDKIFFDLRSFQCFPERDTVKRMCIIEAFRPFIASLSVALLFKIKMEMGKMGEIIFKTMNLYWLLTKKDPP